MSPVPAAKKRKRTLSLDVDLWDRIEDLIGLHGNSLGDVASHIVLNWFSTNQAQIRERCGGRYETHGRGGESDRATDGVTSLGWSWRITIGWTEATWNPVMGCTKLSSSCEHCYAERLTQRFFNGGLRHPASGSVKNLRFHLHVAVLPFLRSRASNLVTLSTSTLQFASAGAYPSLTTLTCRSPACANPSALVGCRHRQLST